MKRSVGQKVVVVVLGVLSMAPTAGDVGGCGGEVKALDARAFALARKGMDCERCRECGIGTARCQRSCDPAMEVETVIPSTCLPLRHDGEVCIRALEAARCEAYASYVDDIAPSTPSECEFCRAVPQTPPALGSNQTAGSPANGAP